MTPRLRRLAALALLASVAAVLPGSLSAARAEEKKKPTGKLEASVTVKGGGTMQSCTLFLKERAVELGKGATAATFDQVPQARYGLGGEATVRTPSGAIKRYVGVQEVSVIGNKTAKATLTLAEAPEMDAFCSACHPGPKDPQKPGQVVRDLHVSGKVLGKQKYLDQVARYNAEVERLVKEGKPHNLPIVLEKRKVVEAGKTVEREFFTCESCHTVHWERGNTSYARAPFRKMADLCQGCHP